MQPKPNMEYRNLGPTGLKVSIISYGAYMFQQHFNRTFPNAEEGTYETVKKALELGINFFDTAEVYASGESEINLGKVFKKLGVNREDIVVSTKVFFGSKGMKMMGFPDPGPNGKGLSRKHIIEGTEASLKRLQLDYVDVIFCHRYDPETPLEETCRAFHTLIEKGKTFYWGTSEWSSTEIASAIEICERLNLHKPVVEQPQYNMIYRERFEVEYASLFQKYGYGTTVWSPLAGGLLTGKYLDQSAEGRYSAMPEDFKSRTQFNKFFAPEKLEGTKKLFKEFEEIATSLGGTIPQLALAWVLKNKDVSTALVGFSSVKQVEENAKAVEIYQKLTPEIEKKLEELLSNKPNPGMDSKNGKPLPSRR